MALLFATLAMLVAMLTPMQLQANTDPIRVQIDGQILHIPPSEQQPVMVGGRTLVPLRIVMEALGFDVHWRSATRTIFLNNNAGGIMIPMENLQEDEKGFAMSSGQFAHRVGNVYTSNTRDTNGIVISLEVPAQIINGATMVPLRAIAEIANMEVDWDPTSRIAIINTSIPQISNLPSPQGPPVAIPGLSFQVMYTIPSLDGGAFLLSRAPVRVAPSVSWPYDIARVHHLSVGTIFAYMDKDNNLVPLTLHSGLSWALREWSDHPAYAYAMALDARERGNMYEVVVSETMREISNFILEHDRTTFDAINSVNRISVQRFWEDREYTAYWDNWHIVPITRTWEVEGIWNPGGVWTDGYITRVFGFLVD